MRTPRARPSRCWLVKWKKRKVRNPEPSPMRESICRRPRKATSVSNTSPSTTARCPGWSSPERYDARAVLVPQRQQEQQILHGLDAEHEQSLGLPLADPS